MKNIMERKTVTRIAKIIGFTLAVLLATKLTLGFGALTSASTAAFSFLIIVILSAFFGDIIVAAASSFAAALCFDYFYLPPVGTFHINEFSDWISLAAFLLASLIISYLTSAAEENKIRANILKKTMSQIKEFGEWLLSQPQDQLTLSGIAQKTLDIFPLEYCSIHVYGEGKWQHFSGSASSAVPGEIADRLNYLKDHPTDLLEIAEENSLGVTTVQIKRGKSPLAFLSVKSKTLPADAIGTIAYMIGVRIGTMMKD